MSGRRLVTLTALFALLVIVAVTAWIGFHVSPEPGVIVVPEAPVQEPNDRFNWELAALVLTGLGTTALAVATGALALSTWQDVRASQSLSRAAAGQLEVSREANELTRREQSERMRPAVIAAVESGSSFEDTPEGGIGEIAVELHNVGGGPAVRLEVGAVYTAFEAFAFVQSRAISTLGPGETAAISLSVTGVPPGAHVDFSAFRVFGRYFDRLGSPAGEIVDWKHTSDEELETPRPS